MKRNIIYIGMLAVGMMIWTSCDHQPDFPGLDVKKETTHVAKYTETYLGAAFTEENPAKETLPDWLLKKFYTCDKGSSAMVTYKYTPSIPEYVSALSAATTYTVTADDYQSKWGEGVPFMYFSPKKPATTHVPDLLKKNVTEPSDKQIVAVNYNQADEDGVVTGAVSFTDDMEIGKLTDKWNVVVTSAGSANTNNWETKIFNDNKYLQITAYNNKAKGPVVSYLISANPIKIFSDKLNLSFDALYTNYVAGVGEVSVLLSEDLTGFTKEEVAAADWVDVTAEFTIAQSANNSGDLTPSGPYSLSTYKGKTVYLAFKYEGDNTVNSNVSGIRLDNVEVGYGEVEAAEFYPVSALYRYNGESTKWEPYTEIELLQPQDYVAMGVSKLSASTALTYVPAYLGLKYPYAQSGIVKAVAFKLSDDKLMAIEFQKSAIGWETTSSVIEMTDEYEFDGMAWVYKRTVPKAALNETFDADGRKIVKDDPTMLEGWLNVALAEKVWYDRAYNNNNYTECTANSATGAVDSWFITPKLEIKSNYILTFDMTSGYYVHDALNIYVSDSFSGNKEDVSADAEGTWTEITENFNLPQSPGKFGTSTNVGSYQLNGYVGKEVYIAFRYVGDKTTGKTSTVQIDNIYVGE